MLQTFPAPPFRLRLSQLTQPVPSSFLPFSEPLLALVCSFGEELPELQPRLKAQTKHDLGSGTMMFSLLGRKGRENHPNI